MGLPVARDTTLRHLGGGLLAGALAAAHSSSGVTIVGEGLELDAITAAEALPLPMTGG